MIALVQYRRGRVCIAEQQWVGKLCLWVTSDGTTWLKSWVQVLEELDVPVMDDARLVYPEYFV